MSAASSVPRFHPGDWVSFPYGSRKVLAEVIEDRGLLGAKGRRLYRVRLDLVQGEPNSFEVPEDDLEAAAAPGSANPLLKVVSDYLRQGKQFTRISPEKLGGAKRTVTFSFSDGSEAIHTFECDRATFMGWWKRTADYLRRTADAFSGPDEI